MSDHGDNWASRAAERLREQKQQKQQDKDYAVHARELITAHVPMLWEDLKKAIHRKAFEFNEAYGSSYLEPGPLVESQTHFAVESKDARLALTYSRNVPSVSHDLTRAPNPWATSPSIKGDLLFEVSGEYVWFVKKGESGTYKSVEDTAKYLLDVLLSASSQ